MVVRLALSVTLALAESMLTIVVPLGIPVPETSRLAISLSVELNVIMFVPDVPAVADGVDTTTLP